MNINPKQINGSESKERWMGGTNEQHKRMIRKYQDKLLFCEKIAVFRK